MPVEIQVHISHPRNPASCNSQFLLWSIPKNTSQPHILQLCKEQPNLLSCCSFSATRLSLWRHAKLQQKYAKTCKYPIDWAMERYCTSNTLPLQLREQYSDVNDLAMIRSHSRIRKKALVMITGVPSFPISSGAPNMHQHQLKPPAQKTLLP